MTFLIALQFLTAIPVRVRAEITPARIAAAMVWFPVVGMMIGALLTLADGALRYLFPATLGAALLLTAWIAITGALHLDGFLDCCDGLLAAATPTRRLEILRDTRVGAFAVAGGACLLLIKFAALMELPLALRPAALLTIPVLSRAAMVYATRAYPYARVEGGLGQLFRQELTWRHVLMAVLIAIAWALLVMGVTGLALAACVWLLTVGLAAWVQRRIGGLTGDVYGALNELAEAAALCLLTCAAPLPGAWHITILP